MSCRILLPAFAFAFALACSGCNVLDSPIVSQSRRITAVTGPAKTLSVGRGMNFSQSVGGTRTIAFPSGTYVLEAEDAGYWYFRAPAPLQFSELSTENWMPPAQLGGLMIAKSAANPAPGGGYIDGSSSTKILVWRMGAELFQLEGRSWKKNF